MKIHEYQARELLQTFGVPVPVGEVVESVEAARSAYERVVEQSGTDLAVVKAQVHAGGRGKAGFVRLVRSGDEAQDAARFMLTHRMVSPQTPPQGVAVRRVLIAAGVSIARRGDGGSEEYYLGITTDRRTRRNVLIASRQGGVDIEDVARTHPQAVLRVPLHPLLGLQPWQARATAFELGLRGRLAAHGAQIMLALARLFAEKDCSLVEINPLVIALPGDSGSTRSEGALLAIDAKIAFDDNALFRHPDIQALADPEEEHPAEVRARRFGLSYIALNGDIGCLVNGAGLAMATMDIIKLHGGEPANFLDVGGSASEQAVTEAFSIILSDARVRGVLVNIFGGIMRCDVIAQGIIAAARHHRNADGTAGFRVPLVVRLEGTNVAQARRLLEDARRDLPLMTPADDLTDAARKVCAAVRGEPNTPA